MYSSRSLQGGLLLFCQWSGVVGQFDKSEVGAHYRTERVAPDAKLNSEYSVNPSNYHHPNLSLASGGTARSVL